MEKAHGPKPIRLARYMGFCRLSSEAQKAKRQLLSLSLLEKHFSSLEKVVMSLWSHGGECFVDPNLSINTFP